MQFQRSSYLLRKTPGDHFWQTITGWRPRRRGMRGWIVAFPLLIGIVMSANSASIALASSKADAPSSIQVLGRHVTRQLADQKVAGTNLPQSNAACSGNCGTPPLFNPNHNPVQQHPRVYTVFWGSKWNNDTANVIPTVNGFFRHLAGSEYNNVLAQYTDNTGNPNNYVHNDVSWGGDWIDTSTPTAPLATPNLANEALIAFQANNWIADVNTQVIIFPEQGTVYNTTNFSDECGEHDAARASNGQVFAFSLIMYNDNPYCNFGGGVAGDMTKIAGHEYAESATDPGLSAWRTNDHSEIGDICNMDTFSYSPIAAGGQAFYVQSLWSNGDNACKGHVGQEYLSPAFPGQHTVQGSILTTYTSQGADGGVLGPPISEEMPIGSGRVSYFTGGCGSNYPTGNCAGIYWSPGSGGAYFVRNAEYQDYVAQGGATSVLGFPVSNDTSTAGGSVTYFNGTCGCSSRSAGIYWSGGSGAHYVRGAEYNEYVAVGEANSSLGFPVTDDTSMNGGSVTYFNSKCGCSSKSAGIYWSGGSGAHYVRGAEYNEYAAVGEANSSLGFPVTDDTSMNGGSVTYFNSKCGCSSRSAGIYWSGGSGAHYVRGAEYNEYAAVGEANSSLGFPVTDDTSMNGGSVTYFNGTCGGANRCAGIYWSGGSGAHYVRNAEYNEYVAMREANGPLAFPVSDDTSIAGGTATYFSANAACGTPGPSNSDGAIYWSSFDGAHEVHGCIYAAYVGTGGPNGVLGFPTSDQYTNARGNFESDFDNGYIEWVNGQAIVHNGCKVSATVTTC